MYDRDHIPRPTVKRLSLYLRELQWQAEAGLETISSKRLGDALDLTDAQVRKDLAYFGQFGQPGIGYRTHELVTELRSILGTDRSWRAVMVGMGNIGRAVSQYGGLASKGFEVVALFDDAPALQGTTIAGKAVLPMTELAATIAREKVEIGMIAVPADAAQDVADALCAAGARGLLNFAPRRLVVPDGVAIVTVDLSVSLEQLAFKMVLREH